MSDRQNIAIIGTGRMGSAFGKRLSALGHAITYGSRTPHSEAVQNLLQEQGATVSASSIAEAASQADEVLLATPHSALAETVAPCSCSRF
ncbi:MAG: NAD(P)-binding domain-containing protein [Pseudomonadota bacterium]